MKQHKTLTRLTSILAAAAAAVILLPGNASAVFVTGTDLNDFRTSYPGEGLVATGNWGRVGLELSWDISFDGTSTLFNDLGITGAWSYSYTFVDADTGAEPNPDISHWILEVSPSINANNLEDIIRDANFAIETGDPTTYGTGASNPGIPGDIYGIKTNTSSSSTFFTYTFWSTRAPVWGDFYAKDGVDGPQGGDVYAYNTGFGTDPTGATTDFTPWIPTPDTGDGRVPEPGTLLLLGGGLLALGLRRSRRRR